MESGNEHPLADQTATAPCASDSPACSLENQPGCGQVETQAAQPPRMCARCHQAPARKNQSSCPKCHAQTMRQYRLRYRQEVTRLKKMIDDLTISNAHTLHAFEKKF